MTDDTPLSTATLSHLLRDNERLWDAVTDLRESLAELDHAKAPHNAVEHVRRDVYALHSRIDEMEVKR